MYFFRKSSLPRIASGNNNLEGHDADVNISGFIHVCLKEPTSHNGHMREVEIPVSCSFRVHQLF